MNRITAATLAGAMALLPLSAQSSDLTELDAAERQAFRAEVRAYLLENPEVLMEAIAVLEQRETAQQANADVALIAANQAAIFEDGYSHVKGNPEGDITIVEFVDYRCGYCRRAFPEVNELIKGDGNIRLITKEFPILGEESTLASRFAIAAQQQAGEEAYGKLHDEMMTFRGNFTEASLSDLAASLDIDPAPVLASMNSPEVDAVIAENRALAQNLGISGTPTFVLPNRFLRGYLPLQGMMQAVAESRAN
ncbi:thioredoxin domain-containing protein [Alphaproteobacteria bacterium KMM 3653]|uniref:Thioredoxin domain-containing protein n=1 Tax=Harenicola maris TaxID=2841044 RepID=A0AAP2CM85_9RHOB|nr:thioredoxin domain-containing protein [Harenicola maris]